jgi:putative salt-induced outer membrane protein
MRWLLLLFLPFSAWAQLVHESEVATLATGGNTNVQTYLLRSKNQYSRRANTYRFSGHYAYGEANDSVNVRDWDATLQYERMMSSATGLFLGEVVEGFRFRNIKARYNTDLGFKYHFIKTDRQNLFSELGYRYTIEDRYNPNENLYESKVRLYQEFNRKITETFLGRVWLEYIPNFTDEREYLINFEVSGTVILTSIFSLKIAYRGFYDNPPASPELRNFDYQYTTALVSKF